MVARPRYGPSVTLLTLPSLLHVPPVTEDHGTNILLLALYDPGVWTLSFCSSVRLHPETDPRNDQNYQSHHLCSRGVGTIDQKWDMS